MSIKKSSGVLWTAIAAQLPRRLMALMLVTFTLGLSVGLARAQDIQPLANPTPDQAADIQSIINIWSAYAADVDSHNLNGVAAMGTPIAGYIDQQDMDTLAPSGCAPYPGVPNATNCIVPGGCVAMAGSGVFSYLLNAGYTNPQVLPKPGHTVQNPVVILSPDSATAKLYIYFSNGRYVNDFVRTQNGWKFQNIRITWPNNNNYSTLNNCGANWTQGEGKLQLLGDDLYYLHTLSGGPQLSAARAAEPALQRVESYVQAAMSQVNSLKYASACPTINQMITEATADPTLDADSKEYFQVIGTRFLEDNSCDGRTAPDRSKSSGAWTAATYWRAYALSGNANAIPTPASIPAWSAAFVLSNQ